MTGAVTNPGDFEVSVNGQLIFSKRQTGAFPDPDAVSCLHCCTVDWDIFTVKDFLQLLGEKKIHCAKGKNKARRNSPIYSRTSNKAPSEEGTLC